ncbi:choice-of-anchor B family protein [Arsukibacterium sp. UBA3155]|uniref:choice-of-anchor B family protein n=1 Tax=Arsukibacterium sp. UBA3155 TaxID=1946058 RepID=UPI0025C0F065|nr:choice-of-anchor B family protein [Arsukibacterium sp. UBA3155]|tara:strand:+ start:30533 stop:33274 length:2742 start_codon:yes stop_codon:yes gene_type:complete
MKTIYCLSLFSLITLCWFCPSVLAHAEHDKARFVAETGQDTGRCDNVLRPCRSIGYALSQAGKGDKVLVASGHYQLNSVDDAVLLLSEIVPVLGGYNRFDHFLQQAPQLNQTVLTGVPVAFVNQLSKRGFRVISDGPGRFGAELNQQLAAHTALGQSQQSAACVNGKAGIFNCDKIDLLGHLPLTDFSSAPSSANDIWGHVDLNSGIEYALIGLNNGTAVVNLADVAAPVEVGTIGGTNTTWRDIKVLQFFNDELGRWQAYAYVSSEANNNIQIIDLNNLPASVSLAVADTAARSAHNLYISNVDYTTNTALSGQVPALHIAGQPEQGGAVSSYSLANPLQLSANWLQTGASRSDYSHDVASMLITDQRASSQCDRPECQVLFDFNEQNIKLWDISGASNLALADFSYSLASYVHSGWWSEDQQYLFVHDELDEVNHGLNTTVRVFELSNLTSPSLAATFSGPTRAIDHNGFVRGNRYYMSNYQRGLTILDITDPTMPVQAGFFDTFPAADSAAFNGMWGVYPYLPSGIIIGSDINSGLYLFRDNTTNLQAGALAFSQNELRVNPGDVAQLQVIRLGGTAAVSVGYEILAGRAEPGLDYQNSSGRLSWVANDSSNKTISITTLDRGLDAGRELFIRLFDPKNGASLHSPSYVRLRFGDDPPRAGVISLAESALSVLEADSSVEIIVRRLGGSDGALSVSYQLQSGTATIGEDIMAASGELSWPDGDNSERQIELQIVADTLLEEDETAILRLSGSNGTEIGASAELTLTILDDDANTPPMVTIGENRQLNASQSVTLTAVATDAEGDRIGYQWQQDSGPGVSLQNANSSTVSFIAPASSSQLVLSVTATDARGAAATASITLTIVAGPTPLPTPPPAAAESSGGSMPFSMLLLGVWPLWRRIKQGYKPVNTAT